MKHYLKILFPLILFVMPAKQVEKNPILGLKFTVGLDKDTWIKFRAGQSYNVQSQETTNQYLKLWIERNF